MNSYASFFYLAFVAPFVGDCEDVPCMESLAKNLGIIFAISIVVGNVTAFIIPYIQFKLKLRALEMTREQYCSLSRPEQEFLLLPVRYNIFLN